MSESPPRTPTVRIESDGPVTTVLLDRPESRNAVDREFRRGLATVETTGLRDVGRFVRGEGRHGAGSRTE